MKSDKRPAPIPDIRIDFFIFITLLVLSVLLFQPRLLAAARATPPTIEFSDGYRRRPGLPRGYKEAVDPPLISAINQNRHQELIRLLADEVDVEQGDSQGLTPLIYAARSGNLPLVQRLLGKGAEINVAADSGITPLTEAISNNHREVVDLLMAVGANRESFSYLKKWCSCQQRMTTKPCTKKEETMIPAANSVSSPSPLPGKSENITFFVQRSKAEEIETKRMSLAPLVASIQSGKIEMTRYLLATYYDNEDNKKQIETALRAAVQLKYDSRKTINLLLSHQAAVDSRDVSNLTPLMYAARFGHIQHVQLLLDKGADINAVSNSGRTPLVEAIGNNRRKTVNLLVTSGANLKPFRYLRKERLPHYPTKKQIAGGGRVAMKSEGMNLDPLISSLRGVPNGMTAYLLKTHYQYENDKEQIDAALRAAVQQNNPTRKIVNLLLDHQAAVNGRDINNFTPLMHTAYLGNTELTALLIARGAELDAVSV